MRAFSCIPERTVNQLTAYKAIILSAGQGSRLLPLTENMPKCLLALGSRNMLEWQLRGLAAAGVGEAVVVTGFRAELVERALEQITPPQMRVRTLFNPFYKVADNLASCWMVRGELNGPSLILNGDTLFEPLHVGHEQIVTDQLHAAAEPLGQQLPARPVVLGHPILDRGDRIVGRKPREEIGILLR